MTLLKPIPLQNSSFHLRKVAICADFCDSCAMERKIGAVSSLNDEFSKP